MAKFKVQDGKMIRVDNANYPEKQRAPGETAGDELQPSNVEGGTLQNVSLVDGEIIFDVVGRIE